MLDVQKPIDLESLKLLEAKVEQFVDEHERMRDARDALLQRLQQKERELAEVSGQLARYVRERSEIKARLERILSRLDSLDLT